MAREGAAFGVSGLTEGDSFVSLGRPEKWSVSFSPVVYMKLIIYLKFGGRGCQEIISQGVYTMERRSLQFVHQWCLSRRENVGESA